MCVVRAVGEAGEATRRGGVGRTRNRARDGRRKAGSGVGGLDRFCWCRLGLCAGRLWAARGRCRRCRHLRPWVHAHARGAWAATRPGRSGEGVRFRRCGPLFGRGVCPSEPSDRQHAATCGTDAFLLRWRGCIVSDLSPQQAAGELGCSRTLVYRLIERGELPGAYELAGSKRKRIPRADPRCAQGTQPRAGIPRPAIVRADAGVDWCARVG
jgi:excisionase family DNA binding protein